MTEFDAAFFAGSETADPEAMLGLRRRLVAPQQVVPFMPYTRLQRILHRLGICRWHTHTRLTLEGLNEWIRETRRDG